MNENKAASIADRTTRINAMGDDLQALIKTVTAISERVDALTVRVDSIEALLRKPNYPA